jgi:cytochrome c551/c552
MRILFTFGFAVFCASAWAGMPAAEQNTLVKRYCAVCHTDAAKNGGLSLEHYDAARRDPGLAAMILSKLNNGAMGAAGNGVPDKVAQEAWLEATREQAARPKIGL